jgi:hypothetical protein
MLHLNDGYYWLKGDRMDDVIFTKVTNNNATFFVWDCYSQSSKEQTVPVTSLPEKVKITQAYTT